MQNGQGICVASAVVGIVRDCCYEEGAEPEGKGVDVSVDLHSDSSMVMNFG